MKRRLARRLFWLFAVLLLVPWPAAYAYDNADAAGYPLQVEAADPSAAPSITAFGGAIGSVTRGDLFYIDASNSAADITATLYLTNSQALARRYRYLIMRVGIYVQKSDNTWEEARSPTGEPLAETYITLRSGPVSFNLAGLRRYKVTTEGGSFYCLSGTGEKATPHFYLTVD